MNHPMTPPPAEFAEWLAEATKSSPGSPGLIAASIARLAYAAGADAELDACEAELSRHSSWKGLRAARRQRAPSPRDQALLAVDVAVADGRLHPTAAAAIRRALEEVQ